jgi:hypothetical protein
VLRRARTHSPSFLFGPCLSSLSLSLCALRMLTRHREKRAPPQGASRWKRPRNSNVAIPDDVSLPDSPSSDAADEAPPSRPLPPPPPDDAFFPLPSNPVEGKTTPSPPPPPRVEEGGCATDGAMDGALQASLRAHQATSSLLSQSVAARTSLELENARLRSERDDAVRTVRCLESRLALHRKEDAGEEEKQAMVDTKEVPSLVHALNARCKQLMQELKQAGEDRSFLSVHNNALLSHSAEVEAELDALVGTAQMDAELQEAMRMS